MSETTETRPETFLARTRFSLEDEAATRRREPGRSSRKTTDWCIGQLHEIVATGPLLDLACGNGRHFSELAAPGFSLVAGDLSKAMLRQAKCQDQEADLVCFEAEKLPFASGSFDGVFSGRFFHHVPTDDLLEQILSEMFRVARHAVAITYKSRFSAEHIELLVKAAAHKVKPKRYFHRLEDFQPAAEKCGWRITKVFNPGNFLSANRGLLFEPR